MSRRPKEIWVHIHLLAFCSFPVVKGTGKNDPLSNINLRGSTLHVEDVQVTVSLVHLAARNNHQVLAPKHPSCLEFQLRRKKAQLVVRYDMDHPCRNLQIRSLLQYKQEANGSCFQLWADEV
ncbi:hypothetical protein P5673_016823 [Acropora cervicornis]|uniref:Uncharacterized protein n=1 Tax=Acropora cervicornis TaxID=6130 RepID=A0AAD9QGI1_ACRCE|nr:hypothetical protein P5673_016823 [Acropora cervicornis]